MSLSNKEILEKAIQKAIDGGWNWVGLEADIWQNRLSANDRKGVVTALSNPEGDVFKAVIFNHDFAKALWSKSASMCGGCHRHHETYSDCDCGFGNDLFVWQYHLQQMVIGDDPIKYLGDNI